MIHSLMTLVALLFCLQTTSTTQDTVPLDKLFDFWVGKWNATWKNADGSVGKATNEVNRILKGKVIKENFIITEDPKNKGVHGLSFSVYNANTKTWKQTWVDNQGAYLDFTGRFESNKRIFERSFQGIRDKYKGKTIRQRMVFYNIKTDSFDWDWESSLDGGKTWKLNWKIKYTRAK